MKLRNNIILLLLVFGSLTLPMIGGDRVVAQSTGDCQACSNGSPQLKEYVSWMSEILTILKQVSNQNPGSVPGQGNNITTQNTRSAQRQDQLKDASLSPSGSSQGIKSDLQALDQLLKSMDATASTLINTKFQRSSTISPSIQTSLATAVNKQVGQTKLFSKQGSFAPSTYQSLLYSLIDLHKRILPLTYEGTGYQFERQGYTSNSGFTTKITTYYSCAQGSLSCNKSKGARQDVANDIKGNWGVIVKSFDQIMYAMSAQYRDTSNVQRNGGIIRVGDSIRQTTQNTTQDIKETWSQRSKARQNKAKAKEELAQQQTATNQTIADTQDAIKEGGSATVASTPTKIQGETSSQSILIQSALNEATDRTLRNHLEQRKYAIMNNPNRVTHKIPELTKLIYTVSQNYIKPSANAVYNQCIAHCKNIPGSYCGSPI